MSASPHELRPVRAEVIGEGVEPLDKFIVELYQYFTPRHDHMVLHMVTRTTSLGAVRLMG